MRIRLYNEQLPFLLLNSLNGHCHSNKLNMKSSNDDNILSKNTQINRKISLLMPQRVIDTKILRETQLVLHLAQ